MKLTMLIGISTDRSGERAEVGTGTLTPRVELVWAVTLIKY